LLRQEAEWFMGRKKIKRKLESMNGNKVAKPKRLRARVLNGWPFDNVHQQQKRIYS
jgi:hypothetical protein